jgi:hypothetical protein
MAKKSVSEQAAEQLVAAELLSIKDIVALSDVSEQYVRKALRAGKLVTTKVPVKEGSKNLKNMITRESYEAWRASVASRTTRDDGRNKYVLYMTPDEEAKLQTMIAGMTFAEHLHRANIKKTAEAAEAE